MLLAVNVGNSRISIGVFDDTGDITLKFKIAADTQKTSDEYEAVIYSIVGGRNFTITSIDAVIVSSVVPQLTNTVINALLNLTDIKPIVIGPGIKTGFPIRIDFPSELGGDIVANTAAVLQLQKNEGRTAFSSVIVDMNTVTTVCAVNANGEFVGCAICPGIQMSFDSMHVKTAQLPNVSYSSSNKAIGKNSQDSVRAGVLIGNAIMLDGFVYRFAKEMKLKIEDLNLTITGEYAECILDICNQRFTYDEDLTLKGLYYIYRNNIK